MRTFFKEKIWPILKLLPRAIFFALIVGWFYLFLVSGEFKLYIYIVGVLISIPGFYIIRLMARKVRDWEYADEEELLAQEGAEE